MDFPIVDLMDEDACYATVVEWLHPEGWPARGVGETTAWSSTAAAAPRSWTFIAVTASECSMRSPARPCTAPSVGSANWS